MDTLDNFDQAFSFTVDVEGKLSIDPKDRGNWTGGQIGKGVLKGTKYGISAAAYPDEDIANLTIDRAKYLSKRDHWDKNCCDQLVWPMSLYIFDASFNGGRFNTVTTLQAIIGVQIDGEIGEETIAAVNKMDSERQAYFLATRLFNDSRSSTWQEDGRGWIKRVIMLAQAGAAKGK